jgi:competence protein ComEA
MKNQNFFWYLLSVLSGVFIAGIIFLLLNRQESKPITIIPAPNPQPIKVYLSGDVVNPGVYSLPQNSRLQDLFALAEVHEYPVDQYNLSAKLYDGQHIQIGEPETSRSQTILEMNSIQININEADVEQLVELPGIGEAKAKDIIQYRETYGYFDRIEDILKVPGIGEVTFNRFKDLIVTNSVN